MPILADDPTPSTPESPRVASSAAVRAYRDIKASGAPAAVKRCWRAIAERLPEDGAVEIGYREIAHRARCTARTAKEAVRFGVALGCIGRETVKLHRHPRDAWNGRNRYTWLGPVRKPVERGQWRAFWHERPLHPEESRV